MVKEIFQRRAQKVNNEDVVKTLLAKVVHVGDAGCRISLVSDDQIWKTDLTRLDSRQPTRILYVLYSSRN